VRWTTTKIVVARLRDAWVKSITLCITSPPITNICPLGMDFQYKKQLIANEKTIEQIKNEIWVDRLIYLSLDWLNGVVANTYNCGICSWCFGWEYPQDGYKQMTIWKDEEFRMMGCN
jgi:amidophosphoribosyltransferase